MAAVGGPRDKFDWRQWPSPMPPTSWSTARAEESTTGDALRASGISDRVPSTGCSALLRRNVPGGRPRDLQPVLPPPAADIRPRHPVRTRRRHGRHPASARGSAGARQRAHGLPGDGRLPLRRNPRRRSRDDSVGSRRRDRSSYGCHRGTGTRSSHDEIGHDHYHVTDETLLLGDGVSSSSEHRRAGDQHAVPISNAARTYAPRGRTLVFSTCSGVHEDADTELAVR